MLQEVFAAAFNAILADDRPINARPWLYRIARNRSLNHLRRVQPIGVDSMDIHLSEHGATTADKVDKREQFRELIADVHELPETQRTALLLREIDALSYEQIAEAMETTIPSVKSLLVRARVSLAEAAEARQLNCEDVRLELGEIAEGLRRRTTPPVRRHLRSCERCTDLPHRAARVEQGARAAAAGRAAAAREEAPARARRALLARRRRAAPAAPAAPHPARPPSARSPARRGAASSGGLVSAGLGALGAKAAAGLAAAALVTAGAVEIEQAPAAAHAPRQAQVVAQQVPHQPAVAPPSSSPRPRACSARSTRRPSTPSRPRRPRRRAPAATTRRRPRPPRRPPTRPRRTRGTRPSRPAPRRCRPRCRPRRRRRRSCRSRRPPPARPRRPRRPPVDDVPRPPPTAHDAGAARRRPAGAAAGHAPAGPAGDDSRAPGATTPVPPPAPRRTARRRRDSGALPPPTAQAAATSPMTFMRRSSACSANARVSAIEVPNSSTVSSVGRPLRLQHALRDRRDLAERALDRGRVARVLARHVAQEARAEGDVTVLVARDVDEALDEARQRALALVVVDDEVLAGEREHPLDHHVVDRDRLDERLEVLRLDGEPVDAPLQQLVEQHAELGVEVLARLRQALVEPLRLAARRPRCRSGRRRRRGAPRRRSACERKMRMSSLGAARIIGPSSEVTRCSPMKNDDRPYMRWKRSSASIRSCQSIRSCVKSMSCTAQCWRSHSEYSSR